MGQGQEDQADGGQAKRGRRRLTRHGLSTASRGRTRATGHPDSHAYDRLSILAIITGLSTNRKPSTSTGGRVNAADLDTFQGLILTLQQFWAEQGCILLQPLDLEVGAGTFHPGTFLRAIGPESWNAAYVQPCRRPTDGRYGDNPNRLQHYYQFQVVMKPSPPQIQEIYLESLRRLEIDPLVTMSASSRTTGNRPRWEPGGWAGKSGSMAWR